MIRPIQNNVVFERDKPAEKSAGGIIRADAYQHPRDVQEATVFAVSPEAAKSTGLEKGSRILVPKRAGEAFERDGRTLETINADQVLAELSK